MKNHSSSRSAEPISPAESQWICAVSFSTLDSSEESLPPKMRERLRHLDSIYA